MAKHFSSDYDSSSTHFTQAEEELDRRYTKSISRGLASFLSPTTIPWPTTAKPTKIFT
ncbi:MAG: hypothetical protein U5J95_03640 [Balneolaceae bacterium]|nr:hypothetical protein [Balneolaceae bacterium]